MLCRRRDLSTCAGIGPIRPRPAAIGTSANSSMTMLAREKSDRMNRRAFITLLGSAAATWPLAVLLIVAALVAAIPALAHSWYPLACCGNMDCFPVACDQLVETGSGWFYVPTGNLFKREQVQPSQDHHCHVCLGRGREHRPICAFIVPSV